MNLQSVEVMIILQLVEVEWILVICLIIWMVEALQMTNRSGVKLALYGMQERVRSIFEIARLDTVFKITETFAEAQED